MTNKNLAYLGNYLLKTSVKAAIVTYVVLGLTKWDAQIQEKKFYKECISNLDEIVSTMKEIRQGLEKDLEQNLN